MPKFNPFRPNGIVSPGMFSGRYDEIRRIEQGLFQTKHGNPHHFLLEGERGIGKSSLLYLVDRVANGAIVPMDGPKLEMIVVAVELRESMSFEGILDEIICALARQVRSRERVKELCRSAWEFLQRFEVSGFGLKGADSPRARDHKLEELTSTLIDLILKAAGTIDGVVILIDEADKPPPSSGLGEFCKLLTERLARRQCENVSLGLAGLPGVVESLRESHASSPRVFQVLKLEPLETTERASVIDRGLDEARRINGFETKITDEAKSTLSFLSEGYPHFLQEFAHCAFDYDQDNHIDQKDVIDGAFSENGALDQLGKRYFSDLYITQIGSDDYRKVLLAMAGSLDAWIDRPEILSKSGVNERIVDNALRALKMKKIIIQNDRVRGQYRLPTKSFAAWIRANEVGRASQDRERGMSLPGLES